MGFLDFFRKKRTLPANHETPNFKILAEKTHFTKNEIAVIYERFLALCNYDTGMLEKIPFVQQPELALNPIIDLAYDMECQNFLNLRLLLNKANTEKEQLELEELEKSAFMEHGTSNREGEEEVQKEEEHNVSQKRKQKKRHRKKKSKLSAGGTDMGSLDGSQVSLDGSQVSLDGSLESIDEESLGSIDGEHVKSMDLSVESSHKKSLQEDLSRHTQENEKVGEVDMADEEYEKNDEESESNAVNKEKEKEIEKEDDGANDALESNSQESHVADKDNHDCNDTEERKKNGVIMKDGYADRSRSSGDEESVCEQVEAIDLDHNHKQADSEGVAVDTDKLVEDTHMNEQQQQLLQEQQQKGQEGQQKQEEEEEEEGEEVPALMPMTSSFFQAQSRLQQLEEEKRLAGIPPTGLDFTHFILILNEFSPKATISSKTSCKPSVILLLTCFLLRQPTIYVQICLRHL